MLKFFRKVRQKLLSEGAMGKYVTYAIGEIVLVVIGILIALQINNWKEDRQLRQLETNYLEGILNDLKADTAVINKVVIPSFFRHQKRHFLLDSLVKNQGIPDSADLEILKSPLSLSKSGRAFYPTVGNYDAMISEGNSGLIRDRELFSAIQELYEVWYSMNTEYRQRRDRMIDEVRARHTHDYGFKTTIETFKNEAFLADALFMYEYKRSYFEFLSALELSVVEVIDQIQAHLGHD